MPPGTVTPIEVVPDLTFFVDRFGDMVSLEIEDAELLEFESSPPGGSAAAER